MSAIYKQLSFFSKFALDLNTFCVSFLYRELSDKDRETIAKIDEVRSEVAGIWEDRLL